MKVYWATKLRGFLRHISTSVDGVDFIDNNNYYEVSSFTSKIKSKLIRSKIFDPIGLFQVVDIKGKPCDCYASYNRFLECDKPYFIYLENPTALYHYALRRVHSFAGKKRFKKCLNDPNLKYIVCMSEACRSTFERINMPVPETVQMKTIYPLVPENTHVNEELIRKKSYDEVLECLYCVQGKRFYTKGGEYVLESIARLQDEGFKIHLTVVTDLTSLNDYTLQLINNHQNITLYDFEFTYDQMEIIYAKTALLLHPSSDDSSPLTVIEALKGGCAVLGSKLYAIPEMVENYENGILIDPLYWIYTPDNMPNPTAWSYEKKVRLSAKRSQKYADDIENSIRTFYENRDMLYSFSKRSLEIANTKFGKDNICGHWEDVWCVMKGNNDYET